MKHKINLVLCLLLSLVLSACSTNPDTYPGIPPVEIYGNQFILARDYTLSSGSIINGDIVAIAANVTLMPDSLLNGNIHLFGSSLENQGTISGDLNLIAGSAYLRNGSVLKGNVNQLFDNVVLEKNSQITGKINTISFPGAPIGKITPLITFIAKKMDAKNWLIWNASRTILVSLLALLAAVFLKKRMILMVKQIQSQPFLSWGAGLLILAGVSILSLLALITICLSPIGLLALIALVLFYLAGWIALGITSGVLLQNWLKMQWPFELQAFLGSLILGIVTSIISGIPCLGWTVNILLGCMGLGSVVISRFGSQIQK